MTFANARDMIEIQKLLASVRIITATLSRCRWIFSEKKYEQASSAEDHYLLRLSVPAEEMLRP